MNTLIRKAILLAALCFGAVTFSPSLFAQHGLLREIYPNLANPTIAGLLSNANYPNNPASTTVIPDFEAPDSFGDAYGQRIRGWIQAPQTGVYVFWIASDDQGQLFLSNNDRPENKALIAQVLGFTDAHNYTTEPNQRSSPVTLQAGQFYYIEGIEVDQSGPDNISVQWQLPDGTIEDPIPNNRVYVELIPPKISRQPQNAAVDEGSPVTFNVQLANRGTVGIQWFRNDSPITDATNLTYSITSASLADNGSRFRVSLTNEFATNAVSSASVFLTVRRDVTAPTLLSAQTSGENGLLTLSFSEAVDPTTATDPTNYSISGGVQVQGATIDSQGRTVILRTSPFTFGGNYLVTVNNVTDRAGQPNPIDPDTQANFTFGFTPLSPDIVYGKSESPGPSTRRTGLTISEIMYNPASRPDGRNIKYIELYNSQPEIVSLGGYRLTGAIDYTFPEGTFLAANSYAVVGAVPLDLQTLYGLSHVYGPFTGDLAGNGALRLLNDQGAVLLDLHYYSSGDWPSAPDGSGPSLTLARPSYGEADPRAWDASQFVGGSPGKAEIASANPFRGLVVNEFLANSDLPQLDFIELYNFSGQDMDLSGVYITDDVSTNKFQIPNGTHIAFLGFLSFNETALGFSLSSAGERIILRNPQKTRIIDSVKFDAQGVGISSGRFPDGAPKIRPLASLTPGTANAPLLRSPIVLNEIMYSPISGNSSEQYVELYNRSTASVNLKGWRLADGISYNFTTDTILAAGGYLVVAKNLALLRTNYAGSLNEANSVGNFSGSLSGNGQRIALERSELSFSTNGTRTVTNVLHTVMNAVTYHSGGRWPQWAHGGGSSMELIDPNSDTEEASSWADSDETAKSSWVTIERRGILDYGSTNVAVTNPSRNLHVLLGNAGEALLDNVQVFRDGGANLLRNPGFEKGLTDWLAGGTHEDSTLELGSGHGGGNALHIRATGRGDTAANRIRVRLSDGLTNGSIATLRADARWLRGSPDILLRLHGNYLEAAGILPVPANLGTPGAHNSRSVLNAAPVISGVQHRPILPVANQDVEVSARVQDPDRVAAAALFYRVDPSTNYLRLPMTYRGAGYYSGTVPGQTNLATVGFYIEAFDASGSVSRFPADAPTTTGVILFGDGNPAGNLAVYRLWLTQTNIDRWRTRERSSNKAMDATFVYNNERVVYNMGALYSGSPFHWPGYTGPLGSSANYVMVFPDDDRFLGQGDFVLNLPANLGSDDTQVREQTFFWMVDQLNMPFNYRRYHHLFLNGRNRGLSGGTQFAYEDAQQPNHDFVKEWLPNDPNGDLYKIEDWFEFDDNFPVTGSGTRFNQDAELIALWTTNLTTHLPELKQERYRWWFHKRASQGSTHDLTEVLRLVRAVNDPDPDKFVAETEALVDIDEWMGAIAVRHAAGDWDSYGYRRGKNMYAYKPQNGKWNLMHWDVAFSFGLGDGPQQDLFDVAHFGGSPNPEDTITKRMMNTPVFRRAYFRTLDRIVNGPFIASRVNTLIDTKFNALVQNGIGANSPDSVKQWIADRREFIIGQLANVSAGFAITTGGGNNYSTNRNTVLLSGTAPVTVKTIKVNGIEYPVTWTSETSWQIGYALHAQQNLIQLDGYDADGKLIPGASDTLSINLTTQPEPIAGHVLINEINYNPSTPNAGFVEIFNSARSTSYDLSGYQLKGAGFTFPNGSVILPGGFLVVANDPIAFGEQYGFTIPIAGAYSGSLQNNGETLSLTASDPAGTNEVVLSSVRYSDIAPWPTLADGSGASLQLIDPTQDPTRVGNWAAISGSATPGATNASRSTLSPFPLFWVNEIQPNNVSGPRDSAGELDPWVELYNSGAAAIPLAGFYLTDDFAALTKWAFPAGATIAPGQRMLVWLDGQPNQSTAAELHTTFRLSSTTRTSLGLVGTQRGLPTVFDYLSVDPLAPGQSYGAFPEGQAVRRETFYQPTPGAANSLSTPPAQVVINEWMADNTHTLLDPANQAYEDWFELYNSGSTAVDLGGYTLTDNPANPAQFKIPAGTMISAHGFLLVWADNVKSTNGPLHVNFKLATAGEMIALYAPDGSSVDRVTFGQQTADVSMGRTPDGGTLIGAMSSPTPGASNAGTDPNALQFTEVKIAQGQLGLTWNGKSGETYRIEYKDNLGDATWTLLRSVTVTGANGTTTDTMAGRHRFYRIVK